MAAAERTPSEFPRALPPRVHLRGICHLFHKPIDLDSLSTPVLIQTFITFHVETKDASVYTLASAPKSTHFRGAETLSANTEHGSRCLSHDCVGL